MPAKEKKKPEVAIASKNDIQRSEALAGVLFQIERCYGKGSIQKLGDATSLAVAVTPSGSLTLDLALGGGLPV